MNKYISIVGGGFLAGAILVYGLLFYIRNDDIKGKDCNPNYSGCVTEYSCSGVGESVQVIGTDVYRLDRDGDGTGCDWSGGTWESTALFRSLFFGGIGGAALSWFSVRKKYIQELEATKKAIQYEQEKSRRERAVREGMICPKCNGVLIKRSGKYGKFIGCSTYPNCKYTRKP